MNKIINIVITSTICFLFMGCGGNSNEPGIGQGDVVPPLSCDIDSQKQFIVDVMHDTYFWYDEVAEINIDDFETLSEVLTELRVEQDRFSYITTQEANDNFFEEGTFEGFGFRSIINQARDTYSIGYVFSDSPAGRAEWRRTDKITHINGVSSAEIIAGDGLTASLSGLEVGDTANFTIMSMDQTESTVELTKAVVTMNTVLLSDVVQTDNQTVGYIALSSFIEDTSNDFSNAISELKTANVSELVLDLRYNGGGRVSASRDVASLIGGSNTEGFDFSRTIHNNKYSNSDGTTAFRSFTNALDLNRVYVLTTSSTCSASELVINSLSPFVEVITIGGTTCGKPVGMYGKQFCDRIILPIEFQSVNHEGFGDYFDGLTATCGASDDLNHQFADVQEGMFAEAIYHMNNASCSPTSISSKQAETKTALSFSAWIPQKQNH